MKSGINMTWKYYWGLSLLMLCHCLRLAWEETRIPMWQNKLTNGNKPYIWFLDIYQEKFHFKIDLKGQYKDVVYYLFEDKWCFIVMTNTILCVISIFYAQLRKLLFGVLKQGKNFTLTENGCFGYIMKFLLVCAVEPSINKGECIMYAVLLYVLTICDEFGGITDAKLFMTCINCKKVHLSSKYLSCIAGLMVFDLMMVYLVRSFTHGIPTVFFTIEFLLFIAAAVRVLTQYLTEVYHIKMKMWAYYCMLMLDVVDYCAEIMFLNYVLDIEGLMLPRVVIAYALIVMVVDGLLILRVIFAYSDAIDFINFNTILKKSSDLDNCPICMETLKIHKQLDCLHTFHLECISSWMTRCPDCPICRRPICGGDKFNDAFELLANVPIIFTFDMDTLPTLRRTILGVLEFVAMSELLSSKRNKTIAIDKTTTYQVTLWTNKKGVRCDQPNIPEVEIFV